MKEGFLFNPSIIAGYHVQGVCSPHWDWKIWALLSWTDDVVAKKATGLDGISSRLLNACTDDLCGSVEDLLNLSQKLLRLPHQWKPTCLVPLPKNQHPKDLSFYRPVAPTSHLMKKPWNGSSYPTVTTVALLSPAHRSGPTSHKLDWTLTHSTWGPRTVYQKDPSAV